MNHGKKKFSTSRAPSKQGPPLGLSIVLALAGGAVLGSGGTYLYFKPRVAAQQSAPPAAGATPPAHTVTMSPPGQFTPAPQPPGEPPPGKVWSVEHGHWHDAPAAMTIPGLTPAAPQTTPASAPPTVTPAATTTPAPPTVAPAATTTPAPPTVAPAATTTPAPAAAPAEKKE